MNAVAQLISLEQFRDSFAGRKPHYEYWDGEARQKAMPAKLHARLQKLLANMLAELGFYSFTELTLRIDFTWEPIPDVTATAHDFPGPYPVSPVDVVIEILSPQDAFTAVEDKCERYAANGVADILVFDPAERKSCKWDPPLKSLVRMLDPLIPLASSGAVLDLNTVWVRFESER